MLEDKESVLKAEGRPALIGGGSDGASVNIGIHHSMKVHLQSMYIPMVVLGLVLLPSPRALM